VDALELPERLLLCLGGEAAGLRAKTRRALDGTVAIPLASGVESLNLSVAAGVLAWEWRRRFPFLPCPGTGDRDPGSEHAKR
jgi:23S rRNA (guanosine2251-2'-O)-methyltransferase